MILSSILAIKLKKTVEYNQLSETSTYSPQSSFDEIAAPQTVELYENFWYDTKLLTLGPSWVEMNLEGNLNDKISAIRIGADITVKLCIHWDCAEDSSAPVS